MLRAIIADDEPAVGKLIRYFLNQEQMPVQIIAEVGDGQAALDAILTQRPDLVFMDIQMPNMDGYKATQAIRRLADKKKADIPIIAMTANAFEEDRKKALAKGMNGHIAKPVDAEKVEKTICGVLSRRSEQ